MILTRWCISQPQRVKGAVCTISPLDVSRCATIQFWGSDSAHNFATHSHFGLCLTLISLPFLKNNFLLFFVQFIFNNTRVIIMLIRCVQALTKWIYFSLAYGEKNKIKIKLSAISETPAELLKISINIKLYTIVCI